MFDTFVRFQIRQHLSRSAEALIAYIELRSLSPQNFARDMARAFVGVREAALA